MGTFHTSCIVGHIVDRARVAVVPQLLVDTGSEYTWVLGPMLEGLGVAREKKDVAFVMANGQRITRSVGFAIITVGTYFTVDEVVFAEPGDLELLGARTLEGLNLTVDPRQKTLVAAGPLPVASLTAESSKPCPTLEVQTPAVISVKFTLRGTRLTVELEDGRIISAPLKWYPRLQHGSPRERKSWQLVGTGRGIHWPELDEDISVEGLLAGRRSNESLSSFERWLASRSHKHKPRSPDNSTHSGRT